eukprot:scaffold98715_cov32-Tisochrysis_lutea.AAC.1
MDDLHMPCGLQAVAGVLVSVPDCGRGSGAHVWCGAVCVRSILLGSEYFFVRGGEEFLCHFLSAGRRDGVRLARGGRPPPCNFEKSIFSVPTPTEEVQKMKKTLGNLAQK